MKTEIITTIALPSNGLSEATSQLNELVAKEVAEVLASNAIKPNSMKDFIKVTKSGATGRKLSCKRSVINLKINLKYGFKEFVKSEDEGFALPIETVEENAKILSGMNNLNKNQPKGDKKKGYRGYLWATQCYLDYLYYKNGLPISMKSKRNKAKMTSASGESVQNPSIIIKNVPSQLDYTIPEAKELLEFIKSNKLRIRTSEM